MLAALASRNHSCRLHHVLRSEDTEVMIAALKQLGFSVELERGHARNEEDVQDASAHPACSALVNNPGRPQVIPTAEADLFVANSGTTMRFLAAMVSLGHGRYRLDGVPRMRERPIEDLLEALRQLGVRAVSEHQNGCPPIAIEANGLSGGHVQIRGDVSSQFLSGLLMAAPLARADVFVTIEGALVSQPYVVMTVAMMRQFGAQVNQEGPSFHIPGQQGYKREQFSIEADASAASYFFGAAAITGGSVAVPLTTKSLQGDVRFVDVLEKMGCQVARTDTEITVHGGQLRGIDVDMNDISDCVMTLAAVSCFAHGPTTIRNVAHIRHKETDRLHALATELGRIGAGVEEFRDGLRITPGQLHGATIETYSDHRMAMSMALVGLRVPGIVIRDPGCVAKTYPTFFEDLQRLCA